MKKRYFIECAYDGTDFSGWQIQPRVETVQGIIENRLSNLYGNRLIKITGCGRTDAGVHASQFFFHVDLDLFLPPDQLTYKLNKMLPRAIAIRAVIEVADKAHARFDAEKRTYRYFIHQKKSPFLQQYSEYYPRPLSVEKMNEAAALLLGRQDFTSFSKLHTDVNNNFCTVYAAKWIKTNNQLCFEITANRFLRNMVRAIVGTLLEIGEQKQPVEYIQEIIALKNREEAGVSVPAKGLFLVKIEYPFF